MMTNKRKNPAVKKERRVPTYVTVLCEAVICSMAHFSTLFLTGLKTMEIFLTKNRVHPIETLDVRHYLYGNFVTRVVPECW
ncbi:MAG: hypothetical protein JRJ51_11345 [Deltaproteobacteria bacterium]|nr:hypothetical protein [Deltaproteobacteria bacterium]